MTVPSDVDLWAPVPLDELPGPLLEARERSDWKTVREELRKVMDGLTTDGRYGRALLQFVMSLPLPSDPVLARYRAAICIDHGDWDGLLLHLRSNPIEAAELIGVRDILLASPDRREPPKTTAEHERFLFEIYEFVLQRAVRRYKRWAHRILAFYPNVVWQRRDIPPGRHFRFRRLQDGVWLAIAESHGGILAIAEACADEAERLGDEGEPGRDVAHDLRVLIGHAVGTSPPDCRKGEARMKPVFWVCSRKRVARRQDFASFPFSCEGWRVTGPRICGPPKRLLGKWETSGL